MSLDIKLPMGIRQAIAWGHKHNDNTFYYINYGYERAFRHLGVQFYWFDDNDDVSNFDFSSSLFFTEGQVDKKIPIRSDCLYMLHNCCDDKYKPIIASNKAFYMQTYTDDVIKRNTPELAPCIHVDYDGKCIYFPWPTDLLPHEIEANKPSFVFNKNSKNIHWVGTIGEGTFGNLEQIKPFMQACNENNINFTSAMRISMEENINRVKQSYMAPTITGRWQQEVGYIPCRITKNISYGQMGITNSPRIYEYLQHKIIFNRDSHRLFYDAKSYMYNMQLSELHSLMDYIKNNHTYLNRIGSIFDFIDKTCYV